MADTSSRFGVPRVLISRDRGLAAPEGAASAPRIQFSTGTARALQQFSNDLFSLSSRMEGQLDQQAEAEGEVEGARDGATGTFETRDYHTIRNRAYNRAGIQTFVATMETRSIVAMAEIQARYANDPAGMEAALNAYHNASAAEIDRVSPGAGALYRQRQTVRSLPAVEAARDNAFKLSKEQAEAAIIESEVALGAEIKQYSADLFSDNPARSQAAASAISVVAQEYMRIYEAVDPVTGRPLYSASERARAKADFQERVFTQATLSWFDAQDDKADAYLRFMEGEFTFDLETSPASVPIAYANQEKVRDQPLSDDVTARLSTAVAATDPNLSVVVTSGGQDAIGTPGGQRTGSTRHDHGGAGDIMLVRDGQPIRPDEDPALYAQFLENAAAAGFTGIGHYPGFVHVGGGSVAAWGPDKTGATLDPVFGAAIERGRANPMDTVGGVQSVDLRQALTDSALEGLESEMRSRITFSNQLADRRDRIEDEALTERQSMGAFELSMILYTQGQVGEDGEIIKPLTQADINAAVRNQTISPEKGEALLKTLAIEKPPQSNQDVYREALRQVYSGQDIFWFVTANASNLSPSDAASLLATNQSLNVAGEGSLSKEEQFQFNRLQDLLTPDGIMSQIDPAAEARKFSALDEYRMRVGEGEVPREVANDLSERAARDFETVTQTALDKLVRPRFSVDSDKPGRIDIQQSAIALKAAHEAGRVTDQSFDRQIKLLRQWDEIQKGLR